MISYAIILSLGNLFRPQLGSLRMAVLIRESLSFKMPIGSIVRNYCNFHSDFLVSKSICLVGMMAFWKGICIQVLQQLQR